MSNDLTESPSPIKPPKDKTKLSDPGVAAESSQKKEKREKHKANGLFHNDGCSLALNCPLPADESDIEGVADKKKKKKKKRKFETEANGEDIASVAQREQRNSK
jgi:hypothetical protein